MRLRPGRTRLAALGLLAATAALAGCSSGSEQAAGSSYRYVQVAPGLDTVPVADRKAAPALAGQELDGTSFDLASARGSVVVVNFWASWCGPCRAETPNLETAAKAATPGVRFLGVNVKDSRSAAVAFYRDRGVSYPSLFDADGSLAASWPVPVTLPTTIVLDRQGRVAARFRAAVGEGDLLPVVQRIAAEGTVADKPVGT